MSTININSWGAGQAVGRGRSAGGDNLTTVLQEVADDFMGTKVQAILTGPAPNLSVAPPPTPANSTYLEVEATATADSIADLQDTVMQLTTLVNEMRTAINLADSYPIKTVRGV